MASWQPPIPHGALCSRQVRDLGPAVALLGWCWDNVKRDGCLELQLKEVAGDMDESYHTIVKWWSKLRGGPFFASVTDRGRAGFRVQFAEEWIEWRVLSTRANKAAGKFELPELATEAQHPDLAIEESLSEENDAQKLFNDSSKTAELPDQVIEAPAYKVLSISGEHDDSCAPRKRGRASPKKTKPEKEEPPPTPIEIRQAIADICAIDLKHAPGNSITQVNATAKKIWTMQQDRQKTVPQTVQAVGMVAAYCISMVYPYSSGQPLSPAALHKHWDAARQEIANGHHPAQAHAVVSGRAASTTTAAHPRAAPERGPLRRASVDWE